MGIWNIFQKIYHYFPQHDEKYEILKPSLFVLGHCRNKWNPLFSGAKIENLNKNLDPGHVFVFSGSKKYFPQHYHSSLQNIDILQRHVNFAPFQKNHFQGYLYFKCALMSNANAYAFIMDISAPRGIVQRYAPKVHFLLLSS